MGNPRDDARPPNNQTTSSISQERNVGTPFDAQQRVERERKLQLISQHQETCRRSPGRHQTETVLFHKCLDAIRERIIGRGSTVLTVNLTDEELAVCDPEGLDVLQMTLIDYLVISINDGEISIPINVQTLEGQIVPVRVPGPKSLKFTWE
jgi:hypothetical protein